MGEGRRECRSVKISCALFVDDTTNVALSGAIDDGLRALKSGMSEWEERNNDAKGVVLGLGTSVGSTVRVLGSWLSAEAHVNHRIRRANGL